jgi:WD40 repeat protein
VFIIGAEEKAVYIYDLRQRHQLFALASTDAVNSVFAIPGTTTFVSGAANGSLQCWDLRVLRNGDTSSQVPSLVKQRESSAVTGIVGVPGSSAAVVTCHGDGACYKWDVTSGDSLVDYCGPDYDPLFTATSGTVGGEAVLYTGGRDGVLRSYRL